MPSCRIALFMLLLLPTCLDVAAQTPLVDDAQLPNEITINGVELVLIPAGWFWYSVDVDTSQLPLGSAKFRDVKVWLDSFYLAKYEARARDLLKFMNSGAASTAILDNLGALKVSREQAKQRKRPHCSLKQHSDGRWQEREPSRNLPATDLSWPLANEFALWLGFRLPTEAEWQKGARGSSDQRDWPWGDTYPDDTYGTFGWTLKCDPAPVDAYPRGRSPYGLYNMAGNVGEFVADWFNQDFDDGLHDGMHNPALALSGTPDPYDGPLKINKGGLWTNDSVGSRISGRRKLTLDRARIRYGVRFAADVVTVRRYLARHDSNNKLKDKS